VSAPPPFDTSRFQNLYWGINGSNPPGISMNADGAPSGAETMTFSPSNSNLPGGKLVWTGVTSMICSVPANCLSSTVDTQLVLTITNMAGDPVALTDPAAAGVANPSVVGGVVEVT